MPQQNPPQIARVAQVLARHAVRQAQLQAPNPQGQIQAPTRPRRNRRVAPARRIRQTHQADVPPTALRAPRLRRVAGETPRRQLPLAKTTRRNLPRVIRLLVRQRRNPRPARRRPRIGENPLQLRNKRPRLPLVAPAVQNAPPRPHRNQRRANPLPRQREKHRRQAPVVKQPRNQLRQRPRRTINLPQKTPVRRPRPAREIIKRIRSPQIFIPAPTRPRPAHSARPARTRILAKHRRGETPVVAKHRHPPAAQQQRQLRRRTLAAAVRRHRVINAKLRRKPVVRPPRRRHHQRQLRQNLFRVRGRRRSPLRTRPTRHRQRNPTMTNPRLQRRQIGPPFAQSVRVRRAVTRLPTRAAAVATARVRRRVRRRIVRILQIRQKALRAAPAPSVAPMVRRNRIPRVGFQRVGPIRRAGRRQTTSDAKNRRAQKIRAPRRRLHFSQRLVGPANPRRNLALRKRRPRGLVANVRNRVRVPFFGESPRVDQPQREFPRLAPVRQTARTTTLQAKTVQNPANLAAAHRQPKPQRAGPLRQRRNNRRRHNRAQVRMPRPRHIPAPLRQSPQLRAPPPIRRGEIRIRQKILQQLRNPSGFFRLAPVRGHFFRNLQRRFRQRRPQLRRRRNVQLRRTVRMLQNPNRVVFILRNGARFRF